MYRRWFALLLLALQTLPALAIVPGPVSNLTVEIEHMLVHQSGQGHHHDGSLGLQFDEDGASLPHVHLDAGHPAALPNAVAEVHVPSGERAVRVIFQGGRLPDPHLEGPLRPPRLSV